MKGNEKEKRKEKEFTPIIMSYKITVAIPCTTTYRSLFSDEAIDAVINQLEERVKGNDGYQWENILPVVKLAKFHEAVSVVNGKVCQEYGITVVKCECVFCKLSELQEFTEALKCFFEVF